MRPKWYETYLPFIVKSPKMQMKWLVATFKKGVLSHSEITPYIRLLLAERTEEEIDELHAMFGELDDQNIEKMLFAADIYDTPRLYEFIVNPTVKQTVIALRKLPPPYEQQKKTIQHKVFQVIHDYSAKLLTESVDFLRSSGDIPEHFDVEYESFQEELKDKVILSSLFPKTRG